MAEYSAGIEDQIAASLRSKGRVVADDVPGVLPGEAARFLGRYAADHSAEGVVFDGSALQVVPGTKEQDVPGARPGAWASPVEQVLSAPPGPALLDSAPAGRPVSKWLWALPLALGVVGGAVAWLLSREESPRTARNLFVTGVAVTVVTMCLPLACGVAGMPFAAFRGAVSGSDEWPAASSGMSTFYYFGTET